MSRRPLLTLLALLVALTLGLVWVLHSVGTETPNESAQAAAPGDQPARPAASAAVPELATPVAPTSASASKPDGDRAALVATPSDVPASELSEGTWVEGIVRMPEGTPLDEHALVVADGRTYSGKKLHKAPIGKDGRFRVAFAKGTRKGWLRIEARYLFLDEGFVVKIDALPSEITLTPHIGGCVHGKLKLSAAAQPFANSLTGATITAGGWRSNGGTFQQRTAKVDEKLEFELGGLDADAHWSYSAQPKGFRAVENEQIAVDRGAVKNVELEVQLGARVAGRVIDASGAPVPKAAVTWQGGDFAFVAMSGQSTPAKDDGTYELTGVPPGKVTLRAHFDGFLDCALQPFDAADGDVKAGLDFVMQRGNSIAGIVRWPDGKPAADVRVEVDEHKQGTHNFGGRDVTKPSVATKADGTFTITGLGAGPFKVIARSLPKEVETQEAAAAKAGAKRPPKARFLAEIEDVKPNTGALEIVLRSGAAVTGRVVDDLGSPVESFTVRATPTSRHFSMFGNDEVAKTFRDTDGSFELVGLADGDWDVYAETKKGLESGKRKLAIPGDAARVDLVIPRPGKLSGFVLGADGAPVAAAHVHADLGSNQYYGWRNDDLRDKKTDETGAFTFDPLQSGSIVVHASADGQADADPVKLDLGPAQEQVGITLRLRVGGTITGEVLDKEGKPDAERSVTTWSSSSGGASRNAVTDATGRFRLEHVVPGETQISTQPSRKEREALQNDNGVMTWDADVFRTKKVQVVDGQEVHVVLGGALKNPVKVSGIVTCDKPVAGAQVSAYRREKGDDDARWKQAKTDAEGHYELTLSEPGLYQFSVQTSTGSQASLEQDVPQGAAFHLDFALPNGRILGRVVSESGQLLEGIDVNLGMARSGPESGLRTGSGRTKTDANGRFEFDALGAGQYTVSAREPDWHNWNEEAKPKTHGAASVSGLELVEGGKLEGIELRLPDGGIVTGTVLDAGGHPVIGAHVHLRHEAGDAVANSWQEHDTDASGRFRIDGVTPGKVTLVALTDSSTSRFAPGTVRSRETSDVTLHVEPGSKLRVIVEHADGKAFQTWSKVVDDQGQDWSWLPHHFEGENADTSALIGPLPPGNYTVSTQMGKDKKVQADVHLSGAGEQTVRLRFTE